MKTQDFVEELIRWEGSIPWLYADIKGFATIGIGNLVREDSFKALPMEVGDRMATEEAKSKAYYAVLASFGEARKIRGEHGVMPGADHYKNCSPIRLSNANIHALARKKLDNLFLPHVRSVIDDFDGLSDDWQVAIVDIAWNCGCDGFDGFHHMIRAINLRDGFSASRACHRAPPCRESRNAWTASQFLKPC